MDCTKIGQLILRLRTEKNLTQMQLAEAMNISDRTVSKWERGLGCPDVSLLSELSDILGVNIESILLGDLESNTKNGGNMRRIKFYTCKECGNVLFSLKEAEISCCGRKMTALDIGEKQKNINEPDKGMEINIQEIDGENFACINHEMTKEHYISFAAFVTYDRVTFIKLYPEQNAEFRFPKTRGDLYICCNTHGIRALRM